MRNASRFVSRAVFSFAISFICFDPLRLELFFKLVDLPQALLHLALGPEDLFEVRHRQPHGLGQRFIAQPRILQLLHADLDVLHTRVLINGILGQQKRPPVEVIAGTQPHPSNGRQVERIEDPLEGREPHSRQSFRRLLHG